MNRAFIIMTGLFCFGAGTTLAEAPKELSDAGTRWSPLMKEFRVPGMAVAVVREGETIFTIGLGRRDPDKDAPVTPDSVFFIGSGTRPFVVAAAMLLEKDGTLDLSAPVRKYLPTFRIADAQLSEKVTVRDLITQTKGLNNDWIDQRANFSGELDEATMDRLLPKTNAAGKFADNGLHCILLGRVIQAASGKSWQDVVRTRLVEPAKMTHTHFSAKSMYAAPNAVVPVEDIAGDFFASRFPRNEGSMHAGAGMGSSATDLARWLAVNLGAGPELLPETVRTAMQSAQSPLNVPLWIIQRESYGMGWTVGSLEGKKLINELGGTVGSRAHVSFMPEAKVGVVVLMNIGGPAALFADAVACDVYQRLGAIGGEEPFGQLRTFLASNSKPPRNPTDTTSRAKPAEGAGLSLPAETYVGTYVHEDWGTLKVSAQNKELSLTFGAMPLELKTSGTDHFEFETAGGTKRGQFLLGPNKTVTGVDFQIGLVKHTFGRK